MSNMQQWNGQESSTEYHTVSTPQPDKDNRINAISKIWSYGTGMLALCIPLMAIAAHEAREAAILLPLAVIGGATVSTVTIWLSKDEKAPKPKLPPQSDPNRIKELEERLHNLETMDRYERLSYAEKMNRSHDLAQSSGGTVAPQPLRSGLE